MLAQLVSRSRQLSREVRGAATLLLLCAAPLAAQVQDTVPAQPADTVQAVDTVTAVTDSVPPYRPLVSLTEPVQEGLWSGVWEWGHDEILRSRAIDLADFLDEVPGIALVRAGFLAQPQAASAFGTGGGRIEVFLDGFELDPLGAATVDLSRIEIAGLRRIRVERRIDRLRIELETLVPTRREPYSRVEAATGEFDTELFRAVFLTPSFIGGPLSVAISRLGTDGIGGEQPASTFGTVARWGLVSESGERGLVAELRRQSLDREDFPFPREGVRTDWVLRGRSVLTEGLVAEGFFGGSRIDDEFVVDTAEADTLATVERLEESSLQGGIRALFRNDALWARSTLRLRSGEGLPGSEAEVAGGVRLPADLLLDGDARLESWSDEDAASVRARVAWAAVPYVRPFAEFSTGTTGVPFLEDSLGASVLTDRTSFRAGTEVAWRGLQGVAAALSVDVDRVATFGLDFDRPVAVFPGDKLTGFEVGGRASLLWEPLWVEGWYTRWSESVTTLYQPTRMWRSSINLHWLPLPSGNLEIFSRFEAKDRGSMLVPIPTEDSPVSVAPSVRTFDFYAQIRVVDVRAFVRWENIANEQNDFDIPGLLLPPARVIYGVKWDFVN